MAVQAVADRATRERLMAWAFALGSACFLLGPFPGYADLVGGAVDAVTFFVGSLLFTTGGGLQTWLSAKDRHVRPAGRAAWWAAVTQSAGTLFFNVSTFHALQTVLSSPDYDRRVWRPDAFGSICFLVSGVIAYRASARHGLMPAAGASGWWQPAVNLLGCVFFGIAAIAGYLLPASGSMIDQAAANWTTSLGAACFLACALGALHERHPREDPGRGELSTAPSAASGPADRPPARPRAVTRGIPDRPSETDD